MGRRSTKQVADLTDYLNKKTGTTPDEREQWRADIKKMLADIDNAKAWEDTREAKSEVMRMFGSFEYWRAKKLKSKP